MIYILFFIKFMNLFPLYIGFVSAAAYRFRTETIYRDAEHVKYIIA